MKKLTKRIDYLEPRNAWMFPKADAVGIAARSLMPAPEFAQKQVSVVPRIVDVVQHR
jgi:hypothetical protein